MKKQATDEQRARAAARREAFHAQCKALAAMTDEQRQALLAQAGGVVTCEGRELSPRNTMLLYMQRPGVSVVGGFRQWQAAGRCVKKGERALTILVPTARKESAVHEETGEGGGRVFFISGSVFDIGQTKELGAADEHEPVETEEVPRDAEQGAAVLWDGCAPVEALPSWGALTVDIARVSHGLPAIHCLAAQSVLTLEGGRE